MNKYKNIDDFRKTVITVNLIYRNLENIVSKLNILTKDFLDKNEDFANNICLRLQVIGESINHLVKANSFIISDYDEPWREIVELRNIISHNYGELNPVEITEICHNDVPKLKQTFDKIIMDNNSLKKGIAFLDGVKIFGYNLNMPADLNQKLKDVYIELNHTDNCFSGKNS
ncbi:MAG: DUF86 domain-containing protein [Succinivibrio sp.]|nr:DUF86 domain-containing protein [Succinivibrio sp.]